VVADRFRRIFIFGYRPGHSGAQKLPDRGVLPAAHRSGRAAAPATPAPNFVKVAGIGCATKRLIASSSWPK